ncbi:hypothetical protein PHPALM_31026 [Phytophthora palmivora]|uniref:PiggyBac transposable element-derived protein domain-containing protein n=1 Tax=Phytophthora palmivora TaxID=4796 RepID=A0A2P4X3M3_9STRA|nr:hypothetical protein PHPALM_31026 [Phytophthora palmivora]
MRFRPKKGISKFGKYKIKKGIKSLPVIPYKLVEAQNPVHWLGVISRFAKKKATAFRSRWAELKKLGWTSSRPSGLSNGFTYIQPGKTRRTCRTRHPQRNLGPILDAVTSDDDDDDTKNAPPSQNPSEVTYVSNEIIFGEVNLTTLDDNPDELTGLDSDGENDDGLDDWSSGEHDESSDRDADDNDVVVQPDIMFDEEFLAAVGGVDSLESISKTVLDDMATTGWTDPTTCSPYPYMSGPYEQTDQGAVSRGNFGRFMSRDRFAHVSRNLHFSSNSDPRAATDRAWKLRPVIESLQQCFKDGFVPPPIMAFDEAMLPSRSPFNRK